MSTVDTVRFYKKLPLDRLAVQSEFVDDLGQLLTASSYTKQQNLNIGGFACLPAKALKASAGEKVQTPPVHEFRIHNPILVDQGIVLTQDGYAVADSLKDTGNMETPWVRVSEEGVWLKKQPLKSEASGLLLKKRGQTNYGHWLCELLVRLHIHALFHDKAPAVIIHRPAAAFSYLKDMYFDSIKLCCPEVEQIYELGSEAVSCSKITYISDVSFHPVRKHPGGFDSWDAFLQWHRTHPARKHPALLDMAGKMAAQAVEVADVPEPCSEKIFITRRPPYNGRKIVNAKEIENYFTDQGYQVVDPAEFTQAEQILMFSAAQTVCGIMCAAFSNALFSPRSTNTFYLAPVYMNGAFYMDLESITQRDRFNLFFCDYVGRPNPPNINSDIFVPFDSMASWHAAALKMSN